MKIDIHCHMVGNGSDITQVDHDVYFNPYDNQHWVTKILYRLVENELLKLEVDLDQDGKISTDEYLEKVYELVTSSEEIDGAVLLALDGVYSPETGELDEIKTDLWVTNTFLNQKVNELNHRLQKGSHTRKRFFFGASVNPNRKDWKSELDFVFEETGAVLIKWIPSVQHIDMMDARHEAFYKRLASNHLPLLCHVGKEYAFPEGLRERKLDNFKLLEKALSCGVTVIAAHCAAPLFPILDVNRMKEFYAFMEKANRGGRIQLWADTSALSIATRVHLISDILKTFPADWLVHGTDFPIPVQSWPHLPWVMYKRSYGEYSEIRKTKNPFDRDIRIKRAHGFSDAILENAEKVLRL